MKDTKRYVDSRQFRKGSYLYENREELEGDTGARSISSMSEKAGNGGRGYAKKIT